MTRWRDDLTPLQRKAFNALRDAFYRCTNPRHPQWTNYGDRGIRVHAGWRGREGFARFLAVIGEPPTARHEIDRIDNERGYEPGNVRWATRNEQTRNTRRNRLITMDGRTMCAADWSAESGVPTNVICSRLDDGWRERDAVYSWPDRPMKYTQTPNHGADHGGRSEGSEPAGKKP